MTWQLCRVIVRSLRVSQEIASSNFPKFEPAWVSEAALALLLINLKDALATVDRLGLRVTFADDLPTGTDITDAVANMRNAICHNGSPLRLFDPANSNSMSFALMHGAGTLLKMNDFEATNPYEDDVAFFYGRQRLLLRRHLYRAIDELRPRLEELNEKFPPPWEVRPP